MNKITTVFFLLIFLSTSCKKDEVSLPIPSTIFAGHFQAKDKNNNIKIKNISLYLMQNNTFSFENNDETIFPIDQDKYKYYIVSGAGKYSIENNIINFQDTLVRTLPAMYPYYLSGKYKYHFDGRILILKSENAGIQYKLDLYPSVNYKN